MAEPTIEITATEALDALAALDGLTTALDQVIDMIGDNADRFAALEAIMLGKKASEVLFDRLFGGPGNGGGIRP